MTESAFYTGLLGLLWPFALVGAIYFAWRLWRRYKQESEELQTVEPAQKQLIDDTLVKFTTSLQSIKEDLETLPILLNDLKTLQDTLVNFIVAFIEQGQKINKQIEYLQTQNLGAVALADSSFVQMYQVLSPTQQDNTRTFELGLLQAQRDAYDTYAESLRQRILTIRAKTAQQQLKLQRGEASVPLIAIGQKFNELSKKLGYLEVESSIQSPKQLQQ